MATVQSYRTERTRFQELDHLRSIFLPRRQQGFFLVLFFWMLANLAPGLFLKTVGVGPLLGCEIVWIQCTVHIVVMLHKFQRDLARRYQKRILVSIMHAEQHREHRLRASPSFL